jgi:hypothetical protein
MITNARIIALQIGGFLNDKILRGFAPSITDIKRYEPTEYSGRTDFAFYVGSTTVHIGMNFSSMSAVAGQVIQVASALSRDKTSQHASMGYVVDKARSEQSMADYVNAHMAKANSLKQGFYEFMTLLAQ